VPKYVLCSSLHMILWRHTWVQRTGHQASLHFC
jgi:hypothetical protein